MSKKFIPRDESFTCAHCGARVGAAAYTARDHCPVCLYSLHVDCFPGDRANPCRGLLEPIGVTPGKKTAYQILYRCQKCHQIVRNQTLRDDNPEAIVELTTAVPLEL